tara:strand:- start:1121 stop:1252 length:132 start_codon:yes stop_codon:yes gene_type:complete
MPTKKKRIVHKTIRNIIKNSSKLTFFEFEKNIANIAVPNHKYE